MKTIRRLSLIAIALVAVAMSLTSCLKEREDELSEESIRKNIIGKWKIVEYSVGEMLTNKRRVNTYAEDGRMYVSESREREGVFYWNNHKAAEYTVNKNLLIQSYNYSRTDKDVLVVTHLDGEDLYVNLATAREEGKLTYMKFKRVNVDYAKAIVGLWEGVAMTGDETFGDANHRIEYKADGSYDYYNKVNGRWVIKAEEENEYCVDGDWLATRWKSEGDADFNYEWWDIDYCNSSEMRWSAKRQKEDGTVFTTTFTWKRIQ